MTMQKILTVMAAIAMVACVGFIACDAVDAEGEESSVVSYSVSYVVDGKTYTVPATGATVTLATLDAIGAKAPEGMTFTGWNSAQTLDGTKYNAESTFIMVEGETSVIMYAEFAYTVYTAQFVAYDGVTVLKTVTGTVETGKVVALSEQAPAGDAIAREGYIFAGWLAAGMDKPVQTAGLGELRADVTYVAQYTVDYRITFVDGDKTYNTCISAMVIPDVGDRTGFTFLGWYTVEGVQVIDPASATYAADTTLTAKWEPVNCYVTFVAGDWQTTVAVLYGQTVVEPALPEGYSGWDFDFETSITSDITVEAIEAPEPEPTGLDKDSNRILLILGGLFVVVLLAVLYLNRDKVSAGIVRKLDKKKEGDENE